MRVLVVVLVVMAVLVFFFLGTDNEQVPAPTQERPLTSVPLKEEEKTPEIKEWASLKKSSAWMEYLDKFASSEPYLALKKTHEAPFVPLLSEIERTLQGHSKFKLETPIYNQSKLVRFVDLSSESDALRFEVHDQLDLQELDGGRSRRELLAEEERFTKMRDYKREMITHRAHDELVILFPGTTHVYDLYFGSFMNLYPKRDDPIWRVKNEIMYVGLPFHSELPFFTEEYWEYLDAFTGAPVKRRLAKELQHLVRVAYLSRLLYFRNLSPAAFSIDRLTTERDLERVGVLVIMDIHNARAPQVFSEMPSAVDLQKAGFNRVKVGIEGWKFGQDYQIADLDAFFRLTLEDVFSGKRAEDDRTFYKQFRPKAYAFLSQGVATNEPYKALHDKLAEWAAGGIQVQITGIEEFDRFDQARLEKAKQEEALEEQ
jgi:hypothetical protein